MSQKFIEINMPKCTLFLTTQEMNSLLAKDPILWSESLERGKHILRSRKQKMRQAGKLEQENGITK